MNIVPIKRALLSVADKTGIVEFAKQLNDLKVEIISTGGTSELLSSAGISHTSVEQFTGMPDLLNGRVKTLHPHIHGGILGHRDIHQAEVTKLKIQWIDLVVVNFYAFANALKQTSSATSILDHIDIGGPTMVRAAAKNFTWVSVITDPNDYEGIIHTLAAQGGLSYNERHQLAEKAFALTAHYDSVIHHYFREQHLAADFPAKLTLQLEKTAALRYGENPHQQACAYQFSEQKIGILAADQYQGKPLSYNNIVDAESAFACVSEFTKSACVIVKHTNPCGVASAADINQAYQLAYQADSLATFGGVVALNETCTATIARAIISTFMEVLIAPSYTEEALHFLSKKPNLRVLKISPFENKWEMKFISGGLLLQEKDNYLLQAIDLQTVTNITPLAEDLQTMMFAFQVVKHIKSNGIVIAKANQTKGIGVGQVSRIDAVETAIKKAGKESREAILASDAFFPFRDSIDCIASTGIRAIIQPGGSIRDEEIIAACNEHQIAMVFTGKRCFRH